MRDRRETRRSEGIAALPQRWSTIRSCARVAPRRIPGAQRRGHPLRLELRQAMAHRPPPRPPSRRRKPAAGSSSPPRGTYYVLHHQFTAGGKTSDKRRGAGHGGQVEVLHDAERADHNGRLGSKPSAARWLISDCRTVTRSTGTNDKSGGYRQPADRELATLPGLGGRIDRPRTRVPARPAASGRRRCPTHPRITTYWSITRSTAAARASSAYRARQLTRARRPAPARELGVRTATDRPGHQDPLGQPIAKQPTAPCRRANGRPGRRRSKRRVTDPTADHERTIQLSRFAASAQRGVRQCDSGVGCPLHTEVQAAPNSPAGPGRIVGWESPDDSPRAMSRQLMATVLGLVLCASPPVVEFDVDGGGKPT